MNSLSWIIYFASIVGNLQLLLILASLAGLFMYFVIIGHCEDSKEFPSKVYPTLLVITILIATLMPDTKTVYMIAGSEAGETVVTSEAGQDILDDVQEIIRIQLEGMKQ